MNSHDLLTRRSTLLFFTEFFQLSGGKKGGTVAHPAPFLRRGSSLGCPWCCATSVCPWLCWSLNSVPAAAFQVGIMLCFFSANWHGYGSIPINTIFRGMNIHESQLFWCELQGYKVLTHCHILTIYLSIWVYLIVCLSIMIYLSIWGCLFLMEMTDRQMDTWIYLSIIIYRSRMEILIYLLFNKV